MILLTRYVDDELLQINNSAAERALSAAASAALANFIPRCAFSAGDRPAV
jgi:hypothetical protein